MNEHFKDLCRWVYYSGLFLNFCDNERSSQLRQDFATRFGLQANANFKTWNQGVVLMLLYGTFVLPKEFWRKYLGDDQNEMVIADDVIFERFVFELHSCFKNEPFEDATASLDLDKSVFLRRLRNAVAHAGVEVDEATNRIIFRAVSRASGRINFSVSSDLAGLTKFLNEISMFFINEINNAN